MADMGLDGLECLDPPPLGTVDLAEAIDEIGERLFIKGNLDTVNELAPHTAEEVKTIAKKRIELGKKSKGYILSSACSISSKVPPENVAILYDAVEEFGYYET
jgi:uroporphyrinogen-III decarboxylase